MSRWMQICQGIIEDMSQNDPKVLRKIAIDLQTKLDQLEESSNVEQPKESNNNKILIFGQVYTKPQPAADFLGITKSKFYYYLRKSRKEGFQDLGQYLKSLSNYDDIINKKFEAEPDVFVNVQD